MQGPDVETDICTTSADAALAARWAALETVFILSDGRTIDRDSATWLGTYHDFGPEANDLYRLPSGEWLLEVTHGHDDQGPRDYLVGEAQALRLMLICEKYNAAEEASISNLLGYRQFERWSKDYQ